ncbi:DNL-type zinc finger [Olea europaea subsp. europaea]|uniref:DNL-type zinc finger n=2 Tax=Olea europaea subsp. europaea TaxID=158383 RepID=A0A8S0SWJ1_OLEEU|nr:DNL-type zinc finger [Olea europaea subsp. europaea]
MAVRLAQRRILSLLAAKLPQNSLSTELHRDFRFSANSFFCRYENFTRRFQTHGEVSRPNVESPEERENCCSKDDAGETNRVSSSMNDEITAKHSVKSNLKVSERHDLAMIFTCKVCDTRSVKTICRESYDKGVVVARCDGCNNLHLIADRLGWFGKPGSVEEFLAARGEEVKKGSVDTLNLTLEDLAGKKNLEF